MTPNARAIIHIACITWSQSMPVSFAIQRCHDEGYYRPFIKRFITAIYEQMDCSYGTWLTHGQFGDGS